MSKLEIVGHNPDVLTCIASLSNDEVFTPPELANRILDSLPQEIFSNPETTFLDPSCKSGVFLREIAKRLIVGLERNIPDLQERINHIFNNQLFGIAITELTSLLSRRSVYCSKYANSLFSVPMFEKADGNIRYKRIQHNWKNGKCVFCGASNSQYGNDNELEFHAYEWIHTASPGDVFNMKFDVIIGNPPYQMETLGAGKQAKPIYHYFVRQAKKLNPRYLVMITPSRWFAGGMGLDEFRNEMLNDSHIKEITDYSLSTECFPGVDIAGGVSYFIWDREYSGKCSYTYIDRGVTTKRIRQLNEYDVFVRDNRAIDIVNKVTKNGEKSITELMSSLGPFGLGTSERGTDKQTSDTYVLFSSAGRSYIDKHSVKSGHEYIGKWKVIIGKATSAGAATAGKDGLRKVIATLEVLEPNAVCTFSYFIGASFDEEYMALNCMKYFKTKFVRYLLLQCLSSINITKERFRFVPIQDFTKPWSDDDLYKKYRLNEIEINQIETTIRSME